MEPIATTGMPFARVPQACFSESPVDELNWDYISGCLVLVSSFSFHPMTATIEQLARRFEIPPNILICTVSCAKMRPGRRGGDNGWLSRRAKSFSWRMKATMHNVPDLWKQSESIDCVAKDRFFCFTFLEFDCLVVQTVRSQIHIRKRSSCLGLVPKAIIIMTKKSHRENTLHIWHTRAQQRLNSIPIQVRYRK